MVCYMKKGRVAVPFVSPRRTLGWVVLTDFASFKPIRVPDNDPSEYIYHFQRRVES